VAFYVLPENGDQEAEDAHHRSVGDLGVIGEVLDDLTDDEDAHK